MFHGVSCDLQRTMRRFFDVSERKLPLAMFLYKDMRQTSKILRQDLCLLKNIYKSCFLWAVNPGIVITGALELLLYPALYVSPSPTQTGRDGFKGSPKPYVVAKRK